MAKIFVVFVTIFILQTSVQAADKIRISNPGPGRRIYDLSPGL
jgi:hypothetical protein